MPTQVAVVVTAYLRHHRRPPAQLACVHKRRGLCASRPLPPQLFLELDTLVLFALAQLQELVYPRGQSGVLPGKGA